MGPPIEPFKGPRTEPFVMLDCCCWSIGGLKGILRTDVGSLGTKVSVSAAELIYVSAWFGWSGIGDVLALGELSLITLRFSFQLSLTLCINI